MAQDSVKSLFCERFHCSQTDYEERAFAECLYAHAKLVSPMLRKLRPDFFAPDFKFVRHLGMPTGTEEAASDALDFQDTNKGNRSFLRTGLRIRVSGRKAFRLAQSLFWKLTQSGGKS